MNILILGICGTFMAGVASIAKEAGHDVMGFDEHVYPPMSDQLREEGIEVIEGYASISEIKAPDIVIIGNVLSRGHEAVEFVLNKGWHYTSGPQWLFEHVLQDRWVLAVSGTHGKTTTSSMLAWILENAGFRPGFLIGGVVTNFQRSARLGASDFFVIEADEYDSAFFDKRPKFVHYHPKTLVINNIEFDHADIYDSVNDVKREFSRLVRTVPGMGRVLINDADLHVNDVISQGCWSECQRFGEAGDWQARLLANDGSRFELSGSGGTATVSWELMGAHNVSNALAAVAAAHHVGVTLPHAKEALEAFKPPKRRMEVIGKINDITVYDDFAHHPTAMQTTLKGLRDKVGPAGIHAIVQLGSYTMRQGVHRNEMIKALQEADSISFLRPSGVPWDLEAFLKESSLPAKVYDHVDAIVEDVRHAAKPGDHVLVMSNRGFDGIYKKLLNAL